MIRNKSIGIISKNIIEVLCSEVFFSPHVGENATINTLRKILLQFASSAAAKIVSYKDGQ